MDVKYNFTPELKTAIRHAQTKARANAQATFSPAHLLWGLLHEEVGLEPLLRHLDKDVHKLRRWAEFRIDRYPKSSQPVEKPQGDEKVVETLMEADRFRKKSFVEAIRPVHVLHAICQPDVAFSSDYLQRFPISATELEQYLGEEAEIAEIQEAVSAIPPLKRRRIPPRRWRNIVKT
jgi:ATP-dependent Clp protease ATP-binding subunit ClpB